ncbi:hypothetical protein ANN_07337 [Periplaneta americana]|uniref:Uncharacterized protein n=1 Tax=Periplaneta americana TaxID=6978 RepID=A0ABQ8SZP9_PERAM|nr:hypothetical protein ANN_07337 [Periplaneta americana]
MDSCFPPLAALSLRDHRGSRQQGRPASTQQPSSDTDNYGKIEILQDLDLYYIRQIAHNLKVRPRHLLNGHDCCDERQTHALSIAAAL